MAAMIREAGLLRAFIFIDSLVQPHLPKAARLFSNRKRKQMVMKKIISLVFALGAILSICKAQSFSGKTNDIVLNFKNPSGSTIVTNLPVIKWVSPKPEYSNSQNAAIEIEAYVTSETDIKSINLIV